MDFIGFIKGAALFHIHVFFFSKVESYEKRLRLAMLKSAAEQFFFYRHPLRTNFIILIKPRSWMH